jgi:hypothetical protein
LVNGAELVLQMGNQPNKSWGIESKDLTIY